MKEKPFETIAEVIDSLIRGREIEFVYMGKEYSITRPSDDWIVLQANDSDSEKTYHEATDVLTYQIENKILNDIILDAEITWRNI